MSNKTDAWHGVMSVVERVPAEDLRVAARVLHDIGRALNHERNGEPFDFYQTALNDAAAELRARDLTVLMARIENLRSLAEAIEAVELAR